MRRSVLILLAAAAPLAAQTQQSTDAAATGVRAARANFQNMHTMVLRSAEMVPESLYTFRPAPSVRTFGQLVAHVAGAENMFCSMILGEAVKAEDEFEKPGVTKAQLIAGLKASGTYCEKAYAMTDAAASATINLFGSQQTKAYALTMNAVHDGEHYGNIVTYLRIMGKVPPSSQR
jgi:uncharacterized damage-inducible protein DinB